MNVSNRHEYGRFITALFIIVAIAFDRHDYSFAEEQDKGTVSAELYLNKAYSLDKDRVFVFAVGRLTDATQSIQIHRLYNRQNWRLFLKDKYLPDGVDTWEMFYKSVNDYFSLVRNELARDWGLQGDVLKAAFYTAVVGHLFPVGFRDKNGENGVFSSASKQFAMEYKRKGMDVPGTIPLSFYLYRAKSGDCNDFATLLYMLLKMAGIEARHVGPDPSHIHVQAVVDGRPYILDAMSLFFSPMPVDVFYHRDQNTGKNSSLMAAKDVYLLPNAGEDSTSVFYRPRRGIRVAPSWITSGMVDKQVKYYTNWDHFKKNMDRGGVARP